MGRRATRTPSRHEIVKGGPRIDRVGVIEGCTGCGEPLHIQEGDVKQEITNPYVVTGTGAKADWHPLISVCEHELVLSCDHCQYWESIGVT